VDHWGIFVFTPNVNENSADVVVKTRIRNALKLDQQSVF